ncbi:immune inhibitor A [bacterium]|nr:immune inhibitor A [bacterium]
MNGKHVWVLLLALILTVGVAGMAAATPLLEVDVPDKATWIELQTGGFDIIGGPEGSTNDISPLYIMGWPEDMDRLSDYTYRIFVEDMEARNRANLDNQIDDMGGYMTYSEVYAWLDDFCTDNPSLVYGPITIGYSYEGRPIKVFKISDNPTVDEDETEVFINALIHAREVVTPLTVVTYSEYLIDNYGTNNRVTDLVDNREIWLLPMYNVDGYVRNEQTDPNGGGMHRKNMSPPDGVDLNRNYSYMWGYDNSGSSPNQYSETYRGPSPASEPETQVVMDFTNAREFAAVLNYHTYSNLIILPWGYTYERPPNYDIYLAYGEYMNQTLGWEVGGPEIIYPTNGGAEDWQEAGDPNEPTSADYHMWSFTFEIGSWSQGGFWPTYNTGVQLANGQIEPLMKFVEVAENPYVLGDPVAPEMTIPEEVGPMFTATWTHDDPNGNDALYYDFAQLSDPMTTDGAELANSVVFERDGFLRSTIREYAGNYSYYSENGNNINHNLTAQFSIPVEANTTLTFQAWYEIENNWDYAYVMVSTDGENFETIPGNITTDYNPNGTNMGNGITGDSNGWVEGIFPLSDYAGQDVWIQLAYITDGGVIDEGIYFDEITPVNGFESMTVLATDLPNPEFDLDFSPVTEPFTAYFTANATDAQDQTSRWANADEVLITPDGVDMVLNLTGINTHVGYNGGYITYSASLNTYVGTPFPNYNYWTMAQLPNGNMYGPVSTYNINIPANADIDVPMLAVSVPGMAPNGSYTLFGHVGDYPNIDVSDSFAFTKGVNATDDNQNEIADWGETGWPESLTADELSVELPTEFDVMTAYPNPFNPTVTVPFALPAAGEVTIAVYNTLGQTVYEQANVFNAGTHQVTVDGSALASGVYLLRVNYNGLADMQKIVLMK